MLIVEKINTSDKTDHISVKVNLGNALNLRQKGHEGQNLGRRQNYKISALIFNVSHLHKG